MLICHLSAENYIHRASVERILRDDLNLFPYKLQSQSELTLEQKAWRLEFGNDFWENCRQINVQLKIFTWQMNVLLIVQG